MMMMMMVMMMMMMIIIIIIIIITNYSRYRTNSGCRTNWSLNDGEPWQSVSRKEPSADSNRDGEVTEICRSRTACLLEDEIVTGVSAWQMAGDMLGLFRFRRNRQCCGRAAIQQTNKMLLLIMMMVMMRIPYLLALFPPPRILRPPIFKGRFWIIFVPRISRTIVLFIYV